ncbi:hypothetical protein [Nonomuraea sp. NPDC003709]|uniref:hypothetical protein n=1 Tax=Nonomuraea sp. NPDC003709 TaxID=3154450 RepID=UPI0033A9FF05
MVAPAGADTRRRAGHGAPANGTTVEVENDGAPELADLIVVPGSGPGANTGVPAEIARGTLPKALACTASESVAGCLTCGST